MLFWWPPRRWGLEANAEAVTLLVITPPNIEHSRLSSLRRYFPFLRAAPPTDLPGLEQGLHVVFHKVLVERSMEPIAGAKLLHDL